MKIFYFINWIVAAETIEGGKLLKGGNYSRKYGSFRIMAIFLFKNWIVAAETIEGGKLLKGGNYSQKYGIYIFQIDYSFKLLQLLFWMFLFRKLISENQKQ